MVNLGSTFRSDLLFLTVLDSSLLRPKAEASMTRFGPKLWNAVETETFDPVETET
jgi:hypothetical protein